MGNFFDNFIYADFFSFYHVLLGVFFVNCSNFISRCNYLPLDLYVICYAWSFKFSPDYISSVSSWVNMSFTFVFLDTARWDFYILFLVQFLLINKCLIFPEETNMKMKKSWKNLKYILWNIPSDISGFCNAASKQKWNMKIEKENNPIILIRSLSSRITSAIVIY